MISRRLPQTWFLALLLIAISCASPRRSQVGQPGDQDSVKRGDINDVLRRHDKELMAVPGVVGVAVGLMKDNKTPRLIVFAAKKTKEILDKIPQFIEGHPVEIEESGVFRPMKE